MAAVKQRSLVAVRQTVAERTGDVVKQTKETTRVFSMQTLRTPHHTPNHSESPTEITATAPLWRVILFCSRGAHCPEAARTIVVVTISLMPAATPPVRTIRAPRHVNILEPEKNYV